MELPRRERGDELLKPGEMTAILRRLRSVAHNHDLTTVIACAFDHRTRMLPFSYADRRMVPGGVRAIGSVLVDAGFEKTRIVLQQWNRNFRPSRMRLDGRIPDIFMVSSMRIHSAEYESLVRDACKIPAAQRPLIIAGGPLTLYEPWDAFGDDPNDPWGADVAVTGEEWVLLQLLEMLLAIRGRNESMRGTFLRARDSGLLDDVPGLVYPQTGPQGAAEELVDTGIQRLLGDLDELPHAAIGFRLMEAPGRGQTLGSKPLEAGLIRRHSPIGSITMTFGCKFACPYCPIPAYNQRQFRAKSGERIADEMEDLYTEYGIKCFFGSDDNFFNDKDRTLGILESLARRRGGKNNFRHKFRWGTEVTVHDTLKLKEHMGLAFDAGIWALWLGVEDMTATLIKKGQSVDKTIESFRLLQKHGICPMPMMMHHDTQPLITRGPKPYGLMNQARLLRKAGAITLQVLMITPATGSKLYPGAFTEGLAYESVGGRRVEPYMSDGNYVVASKHEQPWRKQFNIMAVYLYFYNPLRFLWALVRSKTHFHLIDAAMQGVGIWGVAQTIRRTFGWGLRLIRGDIRRQFKMPTSRIPMRDAGGGAASHALPGTQVGEHVQVGVKKAAGSVAVSSGSRKQAAGMLVGGEPSRVVTR